jgi:hypothetical protein
MIITFFSFMYHDVFKGKNRHGKISQFECRVIEKCYRLRGAQKGKEITGNSIVPSDDDKIVESKNLFRNVPSNVRTYRLQS